MQTTAADTTTVADTTTAADKLFATLTTLAGGGGCDGTCTCIFPPGSNPRAIPNMDPTCCEAMGGTCGLFSAAAAGRADPVEEFPKLLHGLERLLAHRHASAAEPIGLCTFYFDDKPITVHTTEAECELMGGEWQAVPN